MDAAVPRKYTAGGGGGMSATADWEKALQSLWVELASFLVGVVVLGDKISFVPKSSLQRRGSCPELVRNGSVSQEGSAALSSSLASLSSQALAGLSVSAAAETGQVRKATEKAGL